MRDKKMLRKRLEMYLPVGLADQIAEEVADSLWLALEAREACATAWDEGAKAQADGYGMDVDVGPNPYRTEG